ncbi:Signal transduction histidine kinase [Amycolatopsis xylanica]|uniref:Signal transduction histidine kinase n=1 Tax=Amycolatopsis xylanica TaxID=589385 RepID=A0A1H3NIR7_9PSEU|nr:Signal transduction histidine kinase [Amycolatopsis xylanica]
MELFGEVSGLGRGEGLVRGPRFRPKVLFTGTSVDLSSPVIARCVALVPIAYRIAAMMQIVWSIRTVYGSGEPVLLWATGGLLLAANVGIAMWMRARPTAVPLVDVVHAVVLNIFVAVTSPPHLYPVLMGISWAYLAGTVALCTLLRGVVTGTVLVVASVPLLAIMSGLHNGELVPLASVGASLIPLVICEVVALVGLVLIGTSLQSVADTFVSRGRLEERERHRREMHDTVLQVLESLALATPSDAADPAARLAEVRGIARQQAMVLRRSLDESEEPAEGLCARLRTLVGEMAGQGLRAQLVESEIADVPAPVGAALHDAAREALQNTMKHAGTKEAVLRVTELDGGVAVIARDHGVGFDVADRPAGFGIANSILARLAEVGGSARVDSTPGRGTRVLLWVPA